MAAIYRTHFGYDTVVFSPQPQRPPALHVLDVPFPNPPDSNEWVVSSLKQSLMTS